LPNFFTGYFSNNSIFLKWAKSVSDDILGYDIIRKVEGEKEYKQINTSIIKKETFIDKNIVKGKVYYYKIRCIDNNFNVSKFSNAIKIIAE
jgi:fibronectin type 3 domain-containing protein